MEKWIVKRKDLPNRPRSIVGLRLIRYDVKTGYWYDVETDGTFNAEEVDHMEEWRGEVPTFNPTKL